MSVQSEAILDLPRSAPAARKQVVVIGTESVGKSQLIASLTNQRPYVANYRGSTISCECYSAGDFDLVDTPGILYQSDSETTRQAVAKSSTAETVLLVVKGTNVDEDLARLLPLVVGKNAAIVITFRDRLLRNPEIFRLLDALRSKSNLPIKCVDARHLSTSQRREIFEMLESPQPVDGAGTGARLGWSKQAERSWLESSILGRMAAALCLILPAVVAVILANDFAEFIDPYVQASVGPIVERLHAVSEPVRSVLVGKYGLITMGPLMFVWALPTVLIYSLLLGIYKVSGLLDLLTIAIDPMIRPFGLNGRDIVRVLMGFGCNIPAVISTRACSGCSRDGCIAAIAFGSACSYQMGATLAVFSMTGHNWLAIPYLLYLVATTFVYARIVSTPLARSPTNAIVLDHHMFLQIPGAAAVWRESQVTLKHFLKRAMPIFLVITVFASLLDWVGIIPLVGHWLHPLLIAFNLPSDAVLPIILASIRKDGILLFGEPTTVAGLSAAQILTGTYLAGVLLPCLVTAITIATEKSTRFVVKLVGRQMFAAIVFSIVLAWSSHALSSLWH